MWEEGCGPEGVGEAMVVPGATTYVYTHAVHIAHHPTNVLAYAVHTSSGNGSRMATWGKACAYQTWEEGPCERRDRTSKAQSVCLPCSSNTILPPRKVAVHTWAGMIRPVHALHSAGMPPIEAVQVSRL